jgi:hypothetical protein
MSANELVIERDRFLNQATAFLEILAVADLDGEIFSSKTEGVTINDAASGILTLVELAREKIREADDRRRQPRFVRAGGEE